MLEGSSPTFFVPLEMVSWKMVWLDPTISKVKTGGKDWKRKPWKKLFAGSNLVFVSFSASVFFFSRHQSLEYFQGTSDIVTS